jgi:hypothetical protein
MDLSNENQSAPVFLHVLSFLLVRFRYSQCQVGTNYFDFNKLMTLFRMRSSIEDYALPAGYLNWMCSYLTNTISYVNSGGSLSWPYAMPSGVPQVSILRQLCFNIFISTLDLYNVARFSNCLLLADDIYFSRNKVSS